MTPFLAVLGIVCTIYVAMITAGDAWLMLDSFRLSGAVGIESFLTLGAWSVVISLAGKFLTKNSVPAIKLVLCGACRAFGYEPPKWLEVIAEHAADVAGKIAASDKPEEEAIQLGKKVAGKVVEEAVDETAEFAEKMGVPPAMISAVLAAIQDRIGTTAHLEIKQTYNDGSPPTVYQFGDVIARALADGVPSGANVLTKDTVPPAAPAAVAAPKVVPTPPAPKAVAGAAS